MESKQQFIEIIQKLKKEDFEYLNRLFRNCPDSIIQSMKYIKVDRKHVLIEAGTVCDAIYIILKGRLVGTDFRRSGDIYNFVEYSSVEVFGEYEVFGDIKDYQLTIRTSTECEIIVIPSKSYLEWMQKDIDALFIRTRSLMKKIVKESHDERNYSFLTCKDRLVLYLTDAYEKHNVDGFYKEKKTQSELSDRIGFYIRTIQRSIYKLEKEEMISIKHGKIWVSKEEYLKMKKYLNKNL